MLSNFSDGVREWSTVQGCEQTLGSLTTCLRKITAPDVLVSAAAVVREELAEVCDHAQMYRGLALFILTRLEAITHNSTTTSTTTRSSSATSTTNGTNSTNSTTSRRLRVHSVASHLKISLQALRHEIALLSAYLPLDRLLVERNDEWEEQQEQQEQQVQEQQVQEQQRQELGSHTREGGREEGAPCTWFNRQWCTGRCSGTPPQKERRITPGYFCRSFDVTTLEGGGSTEVAMAVRRQWMHLPRLYLLAIDDVLTIFHTCFAIVFCH